MNELKHTEYVSAFVAKANAIECFKRIAARCSLLLKQYNDNREDVYYMDVFERFHIMMSNSFANDDPKVLFYLGLSLQKLVWDYRKILKLEGLDVGVILYDFNCQLHILKYCIKKDGDQTIND